MSKVYLAPLTAADSKTTVEDRLRALWESAGLSNCFTEHDLAAVKLHVGEPGTKTFVSPDIVKVSRGKMRVD